MDNRKSNLNKNLFASLDKQIKSEIKSFLSKNSKLFKDFTVSTPKEIESIKQIANSYKLTITKIQNENGKTILQLEKPFKPILNLKLKTKTKRNVKIKEEKVPKMKILQRTTKNEKKDQIRVEIVEELHFPDQKEALTNLKKVGLSKEQEYLKARQKLFGENCKSPKSKKTDPITLIDGSELPEENKAWFTANQIEKELFEQRDPDEFYFCKDPFSFQQSLINPLQNVTPTILEIYGIDWNDYNRNNNDHMKELTSLGGEIRFIKADKILLTFYGEEKAEKALASPPSKLFQLKKWDGKF